VLASRHAPWVFAGPILVIVLIFPGALRPVWLTRPLPEGPLRRRLESCASRFGVRVRDILVWRTGGRVVNAALVGTIPSLRYVLVTDGLLGLLDEDELEAVFAHEAGHARLHHAGQRILAVLVPIGLWHLAQGWQPAAHAAWQATFQAWHSLAVPALWVSLAAAYLVATVGWFSRLLEYQADLWACRQLASVPDGASRADAVHCYVRALEKVLLATCGNRRRRGWLHPNLKSRVDLVHEAACNSGRAALLHRRVRLARLALLAGATLPVILLLTGRI
jgi:STE24 endopeptidase